MEKYQNVNLNIKELEKDYGDGILKGYTRHEDNTKSKYISNKYKKFMKTIKGIEEYKMDIAKKVGKYGAYLLPLIDAVNEDNSIDMHLFQERNRLSDNQINRLIANYKECNVIKKKGHLFYVNPLIGFYGTDIKLDLGVMFDAELKKVGIIVK